MAEIRWYGGRDLLVNFSAPLPSHDVVSLGWIGCACTDVPTMSGRCERILLVGAYSFFEGERANLNLSVEGVVVL
jgi:hypothetical protein